VGFTITHVYTAFPARSDPMGGSPAVSRCLQIIKKEKKSESTVFLLPVAAGRDEGCDQAPGIWGIFVFSFCPADEVWVWCGCDFLGSITSWCESRFSLGAIYEFLYWGVGLLPLSLRDGRQDMVVVVRRHSLT